MKYFALITLLTAFSLVTIQQVFAETSPNGETISTKTNGVTFKLGDTLQLTIEDYNKGAQKNINIIQSTYPGILSPCGISYFDFVFLRGDHTNISTFNDLAAVKDDAINVAYDMPYNIVSCPLGYFKSIKDVTLESNSNNATITYVNGNGAIEIKSQLIAVRQIDIPFGNESLSLGKYTIVAFSMSGKIGKPLLIEVIANSVAGSLDKTAYPIIESPLKQLKSGILIDQIQCKEEFILIAKTGNGNPACVTYHTGAKLIERGWGVCSEHIGYGRDHPCGPHSSGVVSFEPPKETYLSKTVGEWKNMSLQEVESFYEQYKEEFDFTELGRFLIKAEMRKDLQRHGIENKHDDFRVFSGMVLTSGPPHISFHAVVNATDGNSYLLEGGTFANTIEALRINQLSFYSEVLNPPKIGSGRTPPAWGLLYMEPKVIISPQDGNAPLVEPYSLILDLEKNNAVTFYNNLTIPIRIQNEGSGFLKDEDKVIWKSIIIPPKQSGSVQFNATGNYQWNARSPPNASEEWWGYQGSGQIAAFSNETRNLPFEEKIAIARAFLDNARPDIPWTGMGSSDKGIDIMLNDAIFYMIPDAGKYYKARAQQWVPFDIPIVIEVPKSLNNLN